jgi:hypothetical protein
MYVGLHMKFRHFVDKSFLSHWNIKFCEKLVGVALFCADRRTKSGCWLRFAASPSPPPPPKKREEMTMVENFY